MNLVIGIENGHRESIFFSNIKQEVRCDYLAGGVTEGEDDGSVVERGHVFEDLWSEDPWDSGSSYTAQLRINS